jgi:hypothetical protein
MSTTGDQAFGETATRSETPAQVQLALGSLPLNGFVVGFSRPVYSAGGRTMSCHSGRAKPPASS